MDINRYQRQTILKEFGPKSQQKLRNARILVIGAGGLGIPVLSYLNAMGVGTLGIIECDRIEITNLQRQVLYTEAHLGKSKLEVALAQLKAQNSTTRFITFDSFLTKNNALEIISQFDLVVDGSDNFPTRYLVNDACVILKKPFVSGAIQGFEGQLSVFNYKGGPTYRCLFPKMPTATEIPNCNENGVLGVIPGVIGSLQALEAVKIVANIGEVLSGKILLFNGLLQSYQTIKFKPCPDNVLITELQESYGAESCEPAPTIRIEALLEKISSEKKIQLIDVRTREEFNNSPVPEIKSKNIPLDHLSKTDLGLNLTKPVYLICQSGKRSKIGSQLLKEQYKDLTIFSVEDGINGLLAFQQQEG